MKLYFDGSCYPKNPGGTAGFAWRLLDDDGVLIKLDHGIEISGPTATNNIGEWAAVRNGLRYFKENIKLDDKEYLEILGDSKLVICQLTGEFKCKKDTLIPYHRESLKLLDGVKWTATWIPREKNQECDSLSKS